MAPNIVVSRPTFPTYLLPSISFPFRRRTSSSTTASTPDASQVPSLSSSPTSSTTDETITPPDSPPPPPSYQDAITTTAVAASLAAPSKTLPSHTHTSSSLARTQPDTLRCSTCSCDVAFSSQIVSKGFTGRYGRAYLVAPTPPVPGDINSAIPGPGSLSNVRIGKCENRQLVTGWHVVADITCALCSAKLGWKYVDAKELSQKYKVGKFILEVERVVPCRSWEDVDPAVSEEEEGESEDSDEADGGESRRRKKKSKKAKKATSEPASGRDSGDETAEGTDKEGSEPEEVEIVFDSEDEDDLDDMFSGTWDPEVVARRRSRRVTAARKK